jgi:hypothetical protein
MNHINIFSQLTEVLNEIQSLRFYSIPPELSHVVKLIVLLQYCIKLVLIHQSRIPHSVEVIQYKGGLFSVETVSVECGGVGCNIVYLSLEV